MKKSPLQLHTLCLIGLLFWTVQASAFANNCPDGCPDGVVAPINPLPLKALELADDKWAPRETLFDYLYNKEEVLEVTLHADLQDLLVNKNDPNYRPAVLKMTNRQGVEEEWGIKVKPRGKYRRRVCDFPPLKLNFSKSDLEAHALGAKHDKLKLVTHCLDAKAASKENVLREFLVYEMYSVLTESSFRVQLVEITYIDLHNSMKPFKRYGFLIEDVDELAEGLNGEEYDQHGLNLDDLMVEQASTMVMFQYMIGNEDWSLQMMRNIKGVKLHSGNEIIAIPYDFDFSGFVNAEYALPDPTLGHATLKERAYLGDFISEAQYQNTKTYFLYKKDDLLDTIRKFKKLSPSSRAECLDYVKEFYDLLEQSEIK